MGSILGRSGATCGLFLGEVQGVCAVVPKVFMKLSKTKDPVVVNCVLIVPMIDQVFFPFWGVDNHYENVRVRKWSKVSLLKS